MFHSLALLAISGHPRLAQKKAAAGALAVGSALFSGSLYGLVLLKSRGKQGAQILGPVTPLGGISLCEKGSFTLWIGLIMLAGWVGLIL
jgi:uncharacterized membrane protein YgdD (TMEM256/DUF423 family)